jgi:hypothetical protein
MRFNILLFVLLILPIIGKSQNTSQKDTSKISHNSIEVSTGISNPIGHYARIDIHDIYNQISGLAGVGLNVNVKYRHFISKYLGMEVKGYYNSNKFNAGELYIYSAHVQKGGSYKTYSLLLGPSFLLPINKKWSIEEHFLLGYAILTEPEIIINYNYTPSEPVKLSKLAANSLIYNAGLSFIRQLNDKSALTFNIDYLNGEFNFDKYTYGDSFSRITVERGKQTYDVLNITIGLRFKL